MSLTRGQRFQMNGHKWRVVSVSESRAHCIATVRQPVTVNDRKSSGTRTFVAERRITIDISPNSAVELLAERAS
jgi:hypothetical protein